MKPFWKRKVLTLSLVTIMSVVPHSIRAQGPELMELEGNSPAVQELLHQSRTTYAAYARSTSGALQPLGQAVRSHPSALGPSTAAGLSVSGCVSLAALAVMGYVFVLGGLVIVDLADWDAGLDEWVMAEWGIGPVAHKVQADQFCLLPPDIFQGIAKADNTSSYAEQIISSSFNSHDNDVLLSIYRSYLLIPGFNERYLNFEAWLADGAPSPRSGERPSISQANLLQYDQISGGSEGSLEFFTSNLQVFGATDRGRRRSQNEDGFLLLAGNGFVAGFVADGMGGQADGELASQIVLDSLRTQFALWRPESRTSVRDTFTRALDLAQSGMRDARMSEGGSTVSGAVILDDGTTWVLHVGDSRVHRAARTGDNYEIELITPDQNEAGRIIREHGLASLLRMGTYEIESLQSSLTSAVQPNLPPGEIFVVQLSKPLRPGDQIFISSDGLNEVLDLPMEKTLKGNQDILGSLAKTKTLEEFARPLSPRTANKPLGEWGDNVTVVRLVFDPR